MPRANLTRALPLQAERLAPLLQTPRVDQVVQGINASTADGRPISANLLGALLNVPPRSLREQFASRLRDSTNPDSRGFSRATAIAALNGYLPRVLEWQSVATVAQRCSIHRNHVESLVHKFGKPEMLLYAIDKKMYLSPDGQKLVWEKCVELSGFGNRPRLREFADKRGVPLNHVTAFFSARKISFEKDPLGNVRLTEQQQDMFKAFQARVLARKAQGDMTIDGVRYRSILKVAEQKAALFASPGTKRHELLRARAETALRYWGRTSGVNKKTSIGVYVPDVIAARFKNSVSISEAARLMAVSRSTMKKWCERNPALIAEDIPGKKDRGIVLTTLLDYGWKEKYSQEPKLRDRRQVPVAFVSFAILGLASTLGLSYGKIVSNLPISEDVKKTLESRAGLIPLSAHRSLVRLVQEGLPTQEKSKDRSVSSPGLRKYVRMLMLFMPEVSLIDAQRALERVSAVRGLQPDHLYDSLCSFFGEPENWPPSFEQLVRGARNRGKNRQLFSAMFVQLLARMEEPTRNIVTYGDGIVPDVKVGDIFMHPPTRDFGIVSGVTSRGPALEVNVGLVMEGRSVVFSFEQ